MSVCDKVEQCGGQLVYGLKLDRIADFAIRGQYHSIWKSNDYKEIIEDVYTAGFDEVMKREGLE